MKHSRFPSAVLLSCLCLLLFSGCSTKESIVLLPDPDGHVGSVEIRTKKDPHKVKKLEAAGQTAGVSTFGSLTSVKEMEQAELDKDFGAALAARPDPAQVFILYFHFDTTRLTDASRRLLPEILQTITDRQSTDIGVVGHTDTMGAEQFNLELSWSRARTVADLLLENGVPYNNMHVNSHGEADLLVQTPDNTSEPRNRRVEVTVR